MREGQKKKYSGLEFFKIIATFLVICIHVNPLADTNGTVGFILDNSIARLAVPYFFMASGFFFQKNISEKGHLYYKRYVKRTMKMVVKWNVIYIPVGLILLGELMKTDASKVNMVIQSNLNIQGVFMGIWSFFVYGTGYHLWYVAALVFAIIFVYKLSCGTPVNKILLISLGLYIIGCSETYYGLIMKLLGDGTVKTFLQLYFQKFVTTRNGLFMGTIFVFMGTMAWKNKKSIKGLKLKALASMLLLVAESIFVKEMGYARDCNFYLSLIPSAYYVFHLGMNIHVPWANREISSYLKYIYLTHVGVLAFIEFFMKKAGLGEIWDFGLFRMQVVVILSLTVSHGIILLKECRRRRKILQRGAEEEKSMETENKRILVVEDERRINDTISSYFRGDGFKVDSAYDGMEAVNKIQEERYDLIILDVMLPKLDGWKVCGKIRDKSDTLIIMLTALEEEEDKLKGFQLGVDEYVTKPFSPKVLVARSKALLQRYSQKNTGGNEKYKDIDIEIDREYRSAYIRGEEINLTPKEYRILEYFMDNVNVALSRDQILNNVWGYDYYGDSRVVDTHVKNLRKKLRDSGEFINTLKGFGYRFQGEKLS